LPDNVSGP